MEIDLSAAADAVVDVTAATEVYSELQALWPDSAACRRIPLDFLSGESFAVAVKAHISRFVTSGTPSLFSDVRPLLRRADKAAAIHEACVQLQARFSDRKSVV